MAKFLIDECLTLDLVDVATRRGHALSNHVVRLGKSGSKDWELMRFVLQGDWTFVTRNSYDFRGPVGSPGTRGQYANIALHAGLVCLNAPDGAGASVQCAMFDLVLDLIGDGNAIVNEVIEADLETLEADCAITRYPLPP